MKDGYIQLKITELNSKIQKIEDLLKFEESKLQLIQESIGEYKEVIKKFKALDDFKQHSLDDIKKENEKLILKQVEQVTEKLEKLHKELITSKALDINKILTTIQQREKELLCQTETVTQHSKDIIFLLEHTDILMMKLVNKNILSGHDVIDMNRRSKKKAEQ